MTDLINEIEKAIEKFTDKAVDRSDMDDEGYIRDRFEAQAIAFKSGCAFILPLLKKAIEQRDVFYIKYHLRTLHSDDSVEKKKKYLNSELLKLLGENHD